MKVAIYARVSTDEQTEENQITPLVRYCEGKGWTEQIVYAEKETAWKAGHQHELKELFDDIISGRRKFDYVVIWAIDRLSREGIGPLFQTVAKFEALGVKVISIKEEFLNDNPMRDLVMAPIAWAAKWESDRKSVNTKVGIERRRKEKPIKPRGKDKRRRNNTGYLLRYAKRGAKKVRHEKVAV